MLNVQQLYPENALRSAKNLLLSANANYRLAAVKGGVHPIIADFLSKKHAFDIEKSFSIADLTSISKQMIESYCDAVAETAVKDFSVLVASAIQYIQLHLSQPLSLRTIAGYLHINSAHLSRQFKKETGLNITDYIHRKRIDEAKRLIERGNLALMDIAFSVGYNDLSYFIKIFKRITSITPERYSKGMKQ